MTDQQRNAGIPLGGMHALRELMRQQYEILCDTSKELDLPRERLKTEVIRNVIKTVELEVKYAEIMNGAIEAPFIEADAAETPNQRRDPLLSGPSADHPWRGRSTLHKLKG